MLDGDGQWAELAGLIVCRTGRRRFALDRREQDGGYRVYTPTTPIKRLPDGGEGTSGVR